MGRMNWVAGVAATILAITCSADDGKTTQSAIPQIPDRRYRVTEGDQIAILTDGAAAAVSLISLEDFEKFRKAGDIVGRDGETKAKRVFGLPKGTRILVVKDYSPAPLPGRKMTLQQYSRNLQNSIATKVEPIPVEVRIINGPHADEPVFVWKADIGRLIDDPDFIPPVPPTPAKKKVQRKPAPPAKVLTVEQQAAQKLELGKTLRFEGQRDSAIEYFRKAVSLAPESVAAKEARDILKAMGVDPK